MRTEFLCFSVLRVASGPRLKLASCKSALSPRWFTLLTVLRRWSRCWSYSLLLCGLFYEVICFMSCVILFLCFFRPFNIAITSVRKGRAVLVFSYVCSICACLVLSVSSSSLCLERAAVCDSGTSWTFLLSFWYCEFSAVWIAVSVVLHPMGVYIS